MARRTVLRPVNLPRIKIVNRCILCGTVIPAGSSICSRCARRGLFGGNR